LINQIISDGNVRRAGHEVASRIARLPAASVAHIKRLSRSTYPGIEERIQAECDAFMECVSSEETRALLSVLKQSRKLG
jgi:hypothetical protein